MQYPKQIKLQDRFLTESQLRNMTEKEVFDYCFLKGNKADWIQDCIKELTDNPDKYPLQDSLVGEPWNFILSKINQRVSNWLPEGYKLNPRFLYALETVLQTDKIQVRNASINGKPNKFISGSCDTTIELLDKAFTYSDTL